MQKAFSVLNTPLGLMKLVRCVRYGSGSTACLTPTAPRPSLPHWNTGTRHWPFYGEVGAEIDGEGGRGRSSYISVAAATTLQAACDGTILAHSMPFVLWGFSELNTIPLPRCSRRRRRSCGTVERPESNLRVLS